MLTRSVYQLISLLGICAILLSSCTGIQGADAIQSWLDEPLDGMEISSGETITLRAHARDHNGQGIVEVKFLVNGEIVSIVETSSSLPLVHATTNWSPSAPGTYEIEAMAVGWSGTKNSVRATVNVTGGGNVAPGGNEVATVYYPPEILNVTGPSSIPADGQTYEFTVTFRDQDGDIGDLLVYGEIWSDISLNIPQQLTSGDLTNGTIQFRYKCPVGTNSFSDILSIYVTDANGKNSASYKFALACEGQSAPPPPPQITYPPVITSVNGPSTITANSGRQYLYVSFTDADGDADRLVVKSDQGRWGAIDFGSPLPLDSGNSGNGVVSFYYSCTASSSFSDTLRITIYDAAGNASDAYPFNLGCEKQLQMPPWHFGEHTSLSVSGGHGSIHKIGEYYELCWIFTGVGQIGSEGAGFSFYLYDFQPATPTTNGVDTNGPHQTIDSGWASDGERCFDDGIITGPPGFKAFRLELYRGFFKSFVEYAEMWIYVEP
jgi:hypothetical protein